MKKILKNKKGFTLVELIVVIAILGVLAVIMVPAFTGYVAKAKVSQWEANGKSECTAAEVANADVLSGMTTVTGETAADKFNTLMTELVKDYNAGTYTTITGAGTASMKCEVKAYTAN